VATGTLNVAVTAPIKQRSAASCIATGAYFRFPQARTVLYVGADSSMAVRMSADGQVEDSVKNERCAVSSGALLDIVSRMLEIPVEELGPMSLQATAPEKVSSRCVVFAEGEILSFIHKDPPVPVPDALAGVNQCIADGLWGMVQKVGVPSELLLCGGVARKEGERKEDILAGLHEAIATRVTALVRKVGIADKFVITGGIGRNVGLVSRIEERLEGLKVTLPQEPMIVGAVGAALFALDRARMKSPLSTPVR